MPHPLDPFYEITSKALDYFGESPIIGDRIKEVLAYEPSVTHTMMLGGFGNMRVSAHGGAVYQPWENRIVYLGRADRAYAAHEIGHWALHQISQDGTIKSFTGEHSPRTPQERKLKQFHEMVGHYFELVYLQGVRKGFIRGDRDKKIGWKRARRLYQRFGDSMLSQLLDMTFDRVDGFVNEYAAPICLKNGKVSLIF
jgi:hypothetical protein